MQCLMGLESPIFLGMGLPSGQLPGGARSAQGAARIGLFGVRRHLIRRRHVDNGERALKQTADVLFDGRKARALTGLRSLGIGPRSQPFAVGDVDFLGLGVEAHGSRIPTGGKEAERHGASAVDDLEDGDVVGVGVGHEQELAIRGQAQAARRIARWRIGVQGAADRLQRLAVARRVENADARGVGARDVQRFAVGGESHFRRMAFGRPNGGDLVALQIEYGNAGLAPQTDEQTLAARLRQTSVGIAVLVQFHRAEFVGVVQRHDVDGMAPQTGGEQRFAVGVAGQTAGNEDLRLVGHADGAMAGKQSVREVPGVDDFQLAAAGKKRFAIGSEAQTIKRLIDRHTADNFRISLESEEDDFMRAVTGMQRGEPSAAGMQDEIDGEIAKRDLLADRPQRPLIRQTNRSAWLDARQHRFSDFRFPLFAFRFVLTFIGPRRVRRAEGQARDSNDKQGGSEKTVLHLIPQRTESGE